MILISILCLMAIWYWNKQRESRRRTYKFLWRREEEREDPDNDSPDTSP